MFIFIGVIVEACVENIDSGSSRLNLLGVCGSFSEVFLFPRNPYIGRKSSFCDSGLHYRSAKITEKNEVKFMLNSPPE